MTTSVGVVRKAPTAAKGDAPVRRLRVTGHCPRGGESGAGAEARADRAARRSKERLGEEGVHVDDNVGRVDDVPKGGRRAVEGKSPDGATACERMGGRAS